MEPDDLTKWANAIKEIVAYLIVYGCAGFMLIWGTTHITTPALLAIVVGGGLTLLGAPAAYKADVFRRRNGNGHGNGHAKPPATTPEKELSLEDQWGPFPPS